MRDILKYASLVIRELQIKPTIKYHLTLVSIVVITKTKENAYWEVYREKGPFCTSMWNIVAIMRKRIVVPQKIKFKNAAWFSRPTPRDISKGHEISGFERRLCSCVHGSYSLVFTDTEIKNVGYMYHWILLSFETTWINF